MSIAVVTVARLGAWLVFGFGALAVDVVVARRLLRTDPARFRFRGWSKLGWVSAIFGVVWHLGVIPLPVGAVLACSRLWKPPTPPDPGRIPFAEGDGWPEGWS